MADRSFLEWPFFDDRHRALAARLEAVADELAELEHDGSLDMDAICRAVVARLGAEGLLDYAVSTDPQRPLDVRSICLAREILGYRFGLADFAFAMQGLGSGPIAMFGTDAQRARYLPGVQRGERIAALAMSEPGAGSDFAALTTTARRDGDAWVLDGTKTWISNAGIADQYTVFAKTDMDAGARGISAFIVEADDPGFRVSERIDVIAPHPLGTLVLDECRIPADRILGAPGDGFKAAMSNLDIFRSSVGAAALGFARRALDEALAHSDGRELFGGRLSDFQLTQEKVGDMAMEIDAMALLVYRAAWVKDVQQRRVTREASMAKTYATEAAQQIIDRAVQLHGALGTVAGNKVEELYREIRALRIYEGTTEVNKLVIAAQTYKAHREGA
ncbi:acyl-CoA dehydrogenase family protein [Aquisalimonas lutea]|uniref:acyl-CoA dehydrogenase family protein n=1 Tax=Aquisalimonas lutea TaxID=1327750 RepID=UPI0025B5C1C8|nr:acyl-CoA dehydrogenase family protein [Aquisalimonas lutea]MDN3519495.1 acyl-CoA dehydrogenase family protein [Aquisalimonas lutea]